MPAATTPATTDVLAKAIDRQASALVTIEFEGKRLQFPVKLLAYADEPDDGIYAAVSPPGRYALDRLIKSTLPVQVTFQDGSAAVLFTTFVIKKKAHFWINKTVLLRRPSKVSVVEQRSDARQAVPPRCEVVATVAAVAKAGSAPSTGAPATVVARVQDLSRTGASLILPADQAKGLLATKPRSLRLAFDFNGQCILADAELRNTRPLSSHTVRVGLRFTADHSAPANDPQFLQHLSSFEATNIEHELREQLKRR